MEAIAPSRPQNAYLTTLLTRIDAIVAQSDGPLVIYLEAGHFNPRFGADDFALNTLEDALDLGRYLISRHRKSIKLVYGILIDDLGLACSTDACSLTPSEEPSHSGEALPREIEAVLRNSSLIKRDRVLLFSERTTKNRAIHHLKKKLKSGAEYLSIAAAAGGEDIHMAAPGSPSLLLCNRREHVFNMKCPGIMGQHYADVLSAVRKRFLHASRFLLIDWSEAMDRNKVIQGTLAARYVFDVHRDDGVEADVCNVLFGDDEGEIVELHHARLIDTAQEEC